MRTVLSRTFLDINSFLSLLKAFVHSSAAQRPKNSNKLRICDLTPAEKFQTTASGCCEQES